nr:MAG TPA: hypothetical protein [Bacteriophage sp.]
MKKERCIKTAAPKALVIILVLSSVDNTPSIRLVKNLAIFLTEFYKF